MLLGQNRRRHQHRHLIAGIDRFECGANGQFGFAVADVAAQQPIHRPRLPHVVLDGGDGCELIGRFAIGERGVEFALPFGVGAETQCPAAASASPAPAACRPPDRPRPAGRLPFCRTHDPAADVCQRRPRLAAADIFLHQVDVRGRHENARAAVEFDFQMLFDRAVFLQELHAAVATDAVRQMHDVIAFAQFEKAVDHATQPPSRRAGQVVAMKQLAAGDQHDSFAHQAKAGLQSADREMQFAGCRRACVVPKISRSRSTSASVGQTR